MRALSGRDRLIVALDVPTVAAARGLVERIGPAVSTYKIGLELAMGGGLDFAQELARAGNRVFLDMKLLDIGHTVERAVANVAARELTFLTVHGHDLKTLHAAAKGRGTSKLKLLAVTVLTNLDEADVRQQGVSISPAELVMHRTRLALEAGFDGVVASPQEACAVRALAGPRFMIVTPGIRPAGASTHDQSRISSPAVAILAGADYLVVGRPITQAEDPKAAAQSIVAEIEKAIG